MSLKMFIAVVTIVAAVAVLAEENLLGNSSFVYGSDGKLMCWRTVGTITSDVKAQALRMVADNLFIWRGQQLSYNVSIQQDLKNIQPGNYLLTFNVKGQNCAKIDSWMRLQGIDVIYRTNSVNLEASGEWIKFSHTLEASEECSLMLVISLHKDLKLKDTEGFALLKDLKFVKIEKDAQRDTK